MRDVPLYREILAHAEEEYEGKHEQEDDEEQEQARRERIARARRVARWGATDGAAGRSRARSPDPGGSTDVGRGRRRVRRRADDGAAPERARGGVGHRARYPVRRRSRRRCSSGSRSCSSDEPEYELQDVPFTQVVDEDEKPFSLGALLWPKRWPILGVLILVAFEVFALQYGPRLDADAIDQGINPSPPGTPTDFTIVWQLSLVYVGLLVAATVVGAIRTAWSGRIGEDVLYGLRNRVFSHIQRLSLDYFTDEKAGRIMTRATSDIEAIQVLFQQGLVNMWLQVCTLTVVVVADVLDEHHARALRRLGRRARDDAAHRRGSARSPTTATSRCATGSPT